MGRRLLGRAPHPVIELPIVQHDRHAVVILGDARRGVGGDDGEAGDGLAVAALPHVVDAGADEITLTGPLVGGRYVAILLSIASQPVPTCVIDMPPLAPARERLDRADVAVSRPLPAWL